MKHPILTSLAAAIILAMLLGVGMETAYPQKSGDMFGNEIVSILAFPVIWFFGWLVINALAWLSGGENDRGNS